MSLSTEDILAHHEDTACCLLFELLYISMMGDGGHEFIFDLPAQRGLQQTCLRGVQGL